MNERSRFLCSWHAVANTSLKRKMKQFAHAIWPSSCPNISAGWNPPSSGGFPPSFIMSDSKAAAENPHKKTRTSPYPGSKVEGSQVPDKKPSKGRTVENGPFQGKWWSQERKLVPY
ncbi:ADP-ribose pyrophosphatase, mitochondrial-like isoform X3 [Mustela erminea]|uniref:ADP-ribose pyrophosphatase, mitochondrial-like isoform X3 n=2 Tax=Mustela erminea TaxID=36723 RepID=UPI0013871584|nr:ADP-ribose pyrophosphatase, mitochondrial-like isoform X3 [Mustela erminea]